MSKGERKSWSFRGRKYWSIVTDDAEIVASVTDAYTPHFPPAHATFEVYRRHNGLSEFIGHAEGDASARLFACFSQAFSEPYFSS